MPISKQAEDKLHSEMLLPLVLQNIASDFEHWSEGMRLAYEGGSALALFEAIEISNMLDHVAPKWALQALSKGIDVAQSQNSFDVAFGKPLGKGSHASTLIEGQNKMISIYYGISTLNKAGEAIGPALFEKIGRENAVSGARCRDLYYQFVHMLREYQNVIDIKGHQAAYEAADVAGDVKEMIARSKRLQELGAWE